MVLDTDSNHLTQLILLYIILFVTKSFLKKQFPEKQVYALLYVTNKQLQLSIEGSRDKFS